MASSTTVPDSFTPPKSSWTFRIILLLLLGALCVVGTAFAKEAVTAWQLVHGAPGFAQTQGQIARASTRMEGKDHVTDIAFTYTVGGETYDRDNRYTASSYRDGMLAARAAGRYKVGKPVKVFYDRDQPSLAVLDRDVPTQRAWTRTIYALLFYGIAIFCAGAYIRSRKRMRVLAYAKHIAKQRQAELDAEREARLASR